MFSLTVMTNSPSISEEASVSSGNRVTDCNSLNYFLTPDLQMQHQPEPSNSKKKRSQPGNPDPDAEVIALSPRTLMTTNRFVCEICKKGFQRDQNLQLHRRGHNLPWKLRQKSSKEGTRKRVYVCPETTCVHHHPSRALGDLTGIKKHFSRKHGEKKWKCDKCLKKYAVQSDWKAHVKTCGTKEYRCDCGTIFSRKDSFITHRAFCDALAEESARLMASVNAPQLSTRPLFLPFSSSQDSFKSPTYNPDLILTANMNSNPNYSSNGLMLHQVKHEHPLPPFLHPYLFNNLCTTNATTVTSTPHLSATELLQKAATMGPLASTSTINGRYQTSEAAGIAGSDLDLPDLSAWRRSDRQLTRDFLGVQACSEAADRNELLLDLVTSSTGIHGGSTSKQYTSFAPVTELL